MKQQPKEHKLEQGTELSFILAGKALFTLRSPSGTRFTYKVKKADEEQGKTPVWFVSLLTGQDNETSYSYIGILTPTKEFRTTAKSKLTADSKPVVAFTWVLGRLVAAADLKGVEIWHSGKCGKCGKTLTVPQSIEQGFGPECVTAVLG
jgi:hypothetical protein